MTTRSAKRNIEKLAQAFACFLLNTSFQRRGVAPPAKGRKRKARRRSSGALAEHRGEDPLMRERWRWLIFNEHKQ